MLIFPQIQSKRKHCTSFIKTDNKNYEIQRTKSSFGGFYWKEHSKYNENKMAKNSGLFYKAKHYLNKRSLLMLYYSFIITYINYGNIAWGSTNRTNL